jgi:hypothetical protein
LFLALRKLFSSGNTPSILADSFALFFMPSIFLFIGLISYNFGLAIFLLAPLNGNASSRPWRSVLKYALLFLALYYIHFIIMLCGIGVLIISMLHRRFEKRITFGQLLLALVPVIIIFIIYYFGRSAELHESTVWGYGVGDKVKQFAKAVATFYYYNYSPSTIKAILIFTINSGILIGLISIFAYLVKNKIRELLGHKYTHLGIIFILGAIATPYYIGGFGYSGDRFFWIGAVFVVAGILATTDRITKRLITIITMLSLIVIMAKGIMIFKQGMEDKRFESELSTSIPIEMHFMPMMLTFYYPQYISPVTPLQKILTRICPVINTFNRVPFYLFADRNQVYKGIFKTGILRSDPFDCDVISLVEGKTSDCGFDCRNLLLISTNGFASDLKLKLGVKYNIVKEGQDFILATNRFY